MARRRRIRVPFGTGRRRRPKPWPEAEDIIRRTRGPGDDSDGPHRPPRDPGPPGIGDDDGGAGVREPRRPKPTLPGMAAEATPKPDTFLDLGR